VTIEFWVQMPLAIASTVMTFAALVVLYGLVTWLALSNGSIS
jgi:hypothetical protein